MTDAGKLKIIMEEEVEASIIEFEETTGLTVEEIRIDQRFEPQSEVKVRTRCELR